MAVPMKRSPKSLRLHYRRLREYNGDENLGRFTWNIVKKHNKIFDTKSILMIGLQILERI